MYSHSIDVAFKMVYYDHILHVHTLRMMRYSRLSDKRVGDIPRSRKKSLGNPFSSQGLLLPSLKPQLWNVNTLIYQFIFDCSFLRDSTAGPETITKQLILFNMLWYTLLLVYKNRVCPYPFMLTYSTEIPTQMVEHDHMLDLHILCWMRYLGWSTYEKVTTTRSRRN